MPYYHGVRIQENPTSVPAPRRNEAGVPVIFGTAPVNLAKDPAKATNKLFLCNSFAEAKAAVGYSDDYAKYTLCAAIDAFFKAYAVGPIVICNVLDPAVHKSSYTETLTVVDGQTVSNTEGVLLNGLTLKNGQTALVKDTDYTLSFTDEGKLVVTVLANGVSSISATGTKIDPAAVQASSIIGSYDASTGVETGIELVRKVYPLFGVAPSLLIAPGWSQNPAVGAVLAAKCEEINGMFKCECVLDIDSSDTGAKKHTDVESKKAEAGFNSPHTICVWPCVKYNDKVVPYSAMYAAMTCRLDSDNDSVPNLSPSNKNLMITATVLASGEEINLDTLQANELNAVGVVTAVNLNGYKSWGNNTAAYPTTTDPKDRWIACRRFFSWWGNSFIQTYLEKVDDPANYRLIESIVDAENVRGNALVSEGKCAGIKMEYTKEDNPISEVLNGRILFRQRLAPYTPAEDILNILEFDPTMIETALGGE